MTVQRLFFIFLFISVISSCGTGKKAQRQEVSFDEGIRQINHLVVVYMENHSFDNLYGEFKGANGIKNAQKGNFIQVDEEGKPYTYLPEIPRNNAFPTNLPNRLFNIDQYVPSDKKRLMLHTVFFTISYRSTGGRWISSRRITVPKDWQWAITAPKSCHCTR